MVVMSKEITKRKPVQLINSELDGDQIICNLRAFWDEEPIDEKETIDIGPSDASMTIEQHYKYQYKTLDFQYAIPVVPDIRAYLKAHLADIRAYVQVQVTADNCLVKKIPQTILDEWKAASTVPELKAVLQKILRKIL